MFGVFEIRFRGKICFNRKIGEHGMTTLVFAQVHEMLGGYRFGPEANSQKVRHSKLSDLPGLDSTCQLLRPVGKCVSVEEIRKC